MHSSSPFIDTAAVEAWDAWFRWRERDCLRDVSVEMTWLRSAAAVAAVERGSDSSLIEDALVDAMSSWRLLLDERILASAGTPIASWPSDGLVAVLNAAAFVRDALGPHPRLDLVAFESTAELAVRALDDAAQVATRGGSGCPCTRMRIGIIGLADAFALLGMNYAGDTARATADALGRALAEGSLLESIRLGRDRGVPATATHGTLARGAAISLSARLREEQRRHGLRHERLTAITSQARLALFANNVSDALDPLAGENHLKYIATQHDTRAIVTSGYALTLLRERASTGQLAAAAALAAQASLESQQSIRQVVQAWTDEPIVYPPASTLHAGRCDSKTPTRPYLEGR